MNYTVFDHEQNIKNPICNFTINNWLFFYSEITITLLKFNYKKYHLIRMVI